MSAEAGSSRGSGPGPGPRPRKRRRALPWLAALIVVALLAGWWALRRSVAADEGAWGRVERGALVVGVEVSGTLKAAQSTYLTPPQVSDMWNFKISFMAPEGAEVAPGMPVLRFDGSELERKLLDRAAESEEAAKELEKLRTDVAKREADRVLRLAEAEARHRKLALKVSVPEELSALKELEESKIDLALVERELAYLAEKRALEEQSSRSEVAALVERRARAAARVEEIQRDIQKLTVASPRAGTVIYYTDRGGNKKKVGDSVWRGAQILEIPDLSKMLAEGEVDEADAGRLSEGQRVTLRLDAHPEVEYGGRIRQIGRTVQKRSRNSPIKVVKIEVELAQTDPQRMRPGMRFRGTVEIERRDETLLVPSEAVRMTAEGPAVRRRTGFGHELVRPRLGLRGEQGVEVLDGLRAGDEVLLEPDGLDSDGPGNGGSAPREAGP